MDVSVVPQLGDKKVKIWNSGAAFKQDVIDADVFNTTFGVNYRMGVGGDDRQNHNFTANARYRF